MQRFSKEAFERAANKAELGAELAAAPRWAKEFHDQVATLVAELRLLGHDRTA